MIMNILTFLANTAIIATILSVIQMVYPIPWEELHQVMAYFNIPINYQNTSIAIAVMIVLVAALAGQIRFCHNLYLWFMGARKPNQDEVTFILNIKKDMKKLTGVDMDHISWHIMDSNDINAFALGRNQICLNKGLLHALAYDEVLGVIAHEMGHLHHRDSAYGLSKFYMDIVGETCIRLYGLLGRMISFIQYLRIPIITIFAAVLSIAIALQILCMQWMIRMPLMFINLFSGRQAEYRADTYAFQIGLGAELHNALVTLLETYGTVDQSWWSKLQDTHPPLEKRIERLRNYVKTEKDT